MCDPSVTPALIPLKAWASSGRFRPSFAFPDSSLSTADTMSMLSSTIRKSARRRALLFEPAALKSPIQLWLNTLRSGGVGPGIEPELVRRKLDVAQRFTSQVRMTSMPGAMLVCKP